MAESIGMMAGSIVMDPASDAEGPRRAARLLGAMEAALERLGAFHQPTDLAEMDRIISTVRARWGGDTDAFRAAWAEGRRMTLEQAVAYALGEQE
jgi:hypothetical protein